ncbi:MAG: DUF6311 domain-containing protein [Methylococcales bacterium]
MKVKLFSEKMLSVGPALAVALVAFVTVTGGRIINPTYVDWLIGSDTIIVDPAMHYFGWKFFRHSPLLQFPFGANPDYGMEIGSSIVFSDSIPLLAFLLKPFNAALPEAFQYTGFWILLSFILQAFFSRKILSDFTDDRILLLLGSAFFVFAPPALWRLTGHYALFSQWVLLAGFYLYLQKTVSIGRWCALLIATALIYAYLLVMVGGLWAADILQRSLSSQLTRSQVIAYAIVGTASTAVVMWLAGYFMLGKDVDIEGFGFYRMNLLALIDPDITWSRLLRDQRQGPGDYGGFSYLGLGMLGLAFLALRVLRK